MTDMRSQEKTVLDRGGFFLALKTGVMRMTFVCG